jgi:hypothetical protein
MAAGGAIVLAAAISCTPATHADNASAAPASAATPARASGTAPSAPNHGGPPALTPPLTTAFEVDPGGLRASQAQVLSDAVLWSRADGGIGAPFRSSIFEFSIAHGTTQIRHASPDGMIIQELLASESWIVWFDAAQGDGSDARLFALPRHGGTPQLVDDMAKHVPLAIAPDIALDGADLYWSVPSMVGTTWHGELRHQRLPDGPVEVVVPARDGFVIDWPTARDGNIAYDLTAQRPSLDSRVIYRTPDGATTAVNAQASSEPAMGDGFIVFKQAQRFDTGELAVFVTVTGVVSVLGPGGEPRVSGRYATWYVGRPSEVRLASPLDACVLPIASDSASGMISVSAPSIGAGRVAWLRRDTTNPAPVDRFIVAQIPQSLCGRS